MFLRAVRFHLNRPSLSEMYHVRTGLGSPIYLFELGWDCPAGACVASISNLCRLKKVFANPEIHFESKEILEMDPRQAILSNALPA